MSELKPHPAAEKKFGPFMEKVLESNREKVHSIHLVGSALTPDYDPKYSDVNSILVLHRMDIASLAFLAPLGKTYGRRKISAPLVMTPDYIRQSLDVFPIEFLDIQLLHFTCFGEDPFKDIRIDLSDLRKQCEREVKTKLIGMGRAYLSASGNRKVLTKEFIGAFPGYLSLFRAIIMLYGEQPPLESVDVLSGLQAAARIDIGPFETVRRVKQNRLRLSLDQIDTAFDECYSVIKCLGETIDALEV